MTIRMEELNFHMVRFFEGETYLGLLQGFPDRLGDMDLTRWKFFPSPQSGLTAKLKFRLVDRERNVAQVLRYLEARD